MASANFDDGVGALIDLEMKRYYTLNPTAMLVWRSIESGSSLERIVEGLTDRFDVSPQHARASVERIVAEFAARKLLADPLPR